MHATGRIPNKGFFKALIGAVLAALLLAASPAPASALSAPTLSATAGDRHVTLTWTQSTYATAYEWRKSTDGGTTWGGWNLVHDDAFRQRGGKVGDLTNGTTYTFQVRAVKHYAKPGVGFGLPNLTSTEYSDPSNAVTVTPTA